MIEARKESPRIFLVLDSSCNIVPQHHPPALPQALLAFVQDLNSMQNMVHTFKNDLPFFTIKDKYLNLVCSTLSVIKWAKAYVFPFLIDPEQKQLKRDNNTFFIL